MLQVYFGLELLQAFPPARDETSCSSPPELGGSRRQAEWSLGAVRGPSRRCFVAVRKVLGRDGSLVGIITRKARGRLQLFTQRLLDWLEPLQAEECR